MSAVEPFSPPHAGTMRLCDVLVSPIILYRIHQYSGCLRDRIVPIRLLPLISTSLSYQYSKTTALSMDIEKINEHAEHEYHEPQGLYQTFLEHGKSPPQPRVSRREVRDIGSGSCEDCTDDKDLSQAGPDIEWLPSYVAYLARIKRLAASNEHRSRDLPEGYPREILGPRCWTGSEFVDESKYILTLTHAEIQEVEEALEYFISK